MTGNSLNFIASLVEFRFGDASFYGSMVLCYLLGNALYRTMVHHHHEQPKPSVSARATASPLIVALLALSDYFFYTKGAFSDSLVHAIPLALGFGMLGAAGMDALGGTITFAMTGHMKTVSQGLSDLWGHSDPQKRRWRSANKTSLRVLEFFLFGVLVGTCMANLGKQQMIGTAGMTLPSFLLESHLPVFTIIGIIGATLLQLYDRPLPATLKEIIAFMNNTINKRRSSEGEKVQLSVNLL